MSLAKRREDRFRALLDMREWKIDRLNESPGNHYLRHEVSALSWAIDTVVDVHPELKRLLDEERAELDEEGRR